jgi:hypothetical protein
VHERYGQPILDNNDIALIELVRPIEYSENVQPICMPDDSVCLPTGTKCAATGWGVQETLTIFLSNKLVNKN